MIIKEGFVLREICGCKVVSPEGLDLINFNKLIKLNDSAAFLWSSVESMDFTADTLAGLLVREYGIDMELALRDSNNLLASWIENGLVE